MATIRGGEQIGNPPSIDWSRWADGQVWQLERGVDFTQPAERARRTFLSWASRRDLRTHSKVVDENTIKIQVVRPEPKQQRRRRRGGPSLIESTRDAEIVDA